MYTIYNYYIEREAELKKERQTHRQIDRGSEAK